MGKKKEYKKPLLADHDAGEDEYDSDPQDGFGTLKVENVDDEAAFTSQTSMFSSFDTDDDDSVVNPSSANGGDDDIGESFRSVDSGHKRASRTRTSQRRSIRNLTHSPGTMSNSGRATRPCDRTRQDRKSAISPGALSRRSGAGGGGTNTTSPGALRRHSVVGSRGASNSPHHLRRGARARRRSMEEVSAHEAIEKGSGSQRGGDRSKAMAKNNGISPNMGTSMRMLYSGHGAKEGLATPDLDDQESDHEDEFAEDDIAEEVSADDAELVRDELADLEGLIQAAKGVEISS